MTKFRCYAHNNHLTFWYVFFQIPTPFNLHFQNSKSTENEKYFPKYDANSLYGKPNLN